LDHFLPDLEGEFVVRRHKHAFNLMESKPFRPQKTGAVVELTPSDSTIRKFFARSEVLVIFNFIASAA